MRYATVCSGVESAGVGFDELGWEIQWQSEVNDHASAVLRHHYPDVENYGDFTRIQDAPAVDVICAGTPCQAFSVAGLREGLDDVRGNLTLQFLELLGRLRPRWFVWENVPGVLSMEGGWDFGAILGGMGQLGYGVAYRVLDAQFFGVPQRRRRVFVVGHSSGDVRRAAAVLFERESVSGYSPQGGEAGQDIARPLGAGTRDSRRDDLDHGAFITDPISAHEGRTYTHEGKNNFRMRNVVYETQAYGAYRESDKGSALRGIGESRGQGDLVLFDKRAHGYYGEAETASTVRGDGQPDTKDLVVGYGGEVSDTVSCKWHKGTAGPAGNECGNLVYDARGNGDGQVANTLAGDHQNRITDYTAIVFDQAQITHPENRSKNFDKCPTLAASSHSKPTVAYSIHQNDDGRKDRPGGGLYVNEETISPALRAGTGKSRTLVAERLIRRLTPLECERLQGLPDNWTQYGEYPDGKKKVSDTQRYKLIGNAMAVPVLKWIGGRIAMVDLY